ncbi:Alpha/Beta hydrolase protein [Multifurca ochricompacta]|uniref:Alpha/Beta hydrolase protein n=1 Tax=Multifurca ochricompacta TaxID=376703 RepID=A0AAD4LWW3_9AGAM|nr:Alpha/Beta hydrolase protein [Multifurca ochricompacta]
MVHQYRNHPIRGLYLLYELITVLSFRLPYWIWRNLFRSRRPRSSWSLKKAVAVELVKRTWLISIRQADHTRVTQDPDVKHVWLNPTPDLLNSKLRAYAAKANVVPASIPGYWFDKKGVDTPIGARPRPGERVIYTLHGGAYFRYSASPKDSPANIARGLLKHCPGVDRLFAVEYRLSRAAPEDIAANAFPAALLDAIAGYTYLVETVGFSPKDIIIEGDSAGGNLALVLTRYLVENVGLVAGLPAPPGALLLLSPWTNVSLGLPPPGSRTAANFNADYLTIPDGGDYALRAFLGPHDHLDPYISPGSTDPRMPPVSFEGFPPTFVNAGGAELLIDEILVLVERMKNDLGEKVTYYEAPDAVHDYTQFLWAEPERTNTLQEIAKWVKDV